jgi:hypothetical protein
MLWLSSVEAQHTRTRINTAVDLARYIGYLWIRRVPDKSGHI